MKKWVNLASLISVVVTGIVVICTFLTTYQFYYVGQTFNSYSAIQISLALTMGIWAFRFWICEHGNKRAIYSLFCLSISIVLLYLMQFVN
ncbi:MAG: hypothetical protein ACRC2K_06440 [Clostridium sp.]